MGMCGSAAQRSPQCQNPGIPAASIYAGGARAPSLLYWGCRHWGPAALQGAVLQGKLGSSTPRPGHSLPRVRPPPPAGSDACWRDGLPGKLRERGCVLPFHPVLLPVTLHLLLPDGGWGAEHRVPAGASAPGGALTRRGWALPSGPSIATPPPQCSAVLCFHSPTRILNAKEKSELSRGKKNHPNPAAAPGFPPCGTESWGRATPSPAQTQTHSACPHIAVWGQPGGAAPGWGASVGQGQSSLPLIRALWHRRAPQCGKGSRAWCVLAPCCPWVAEGHVLITSFSGGSTAVMINLRRSVLQSVFLSVSNAGKCSSPACHPHTLPCPRTQGKSHPDACNGRGGGGVSWGLPWGKWRHGGRKLQWVREPRVGMDALCALWRGSMGRCPCSGWLPAHTALAQPTQRCGTRRGHRLGWDVQCCHGGPGEAPPSFTIPCSGPGPTQGKGGPGGSGCQLGSMPATKAAQRTRAE